MTCLEAQSNIMAFVEKRLPDDKVSDFVRHMKYCPNCHDELEIYYTLISGMKQLDDNEELTKDIIQDLNDELQLLESRHRKVKGFKISTFGAIIIAAIVMMFFFYTSALLRVYNFEQVRIKESQGDHYFYTNFKDVINLEDDIIKEYESNNVRTKDTFYHTIRFYNLTHFDLDNEEEIGANDE